MSLKYSKIHRIGKLETERIFDGDGLVEVTEKIDGANCRFWLDQVAGDLRVGSRTQEWNPQTSPDDFLQGLGKWAKAHEADLTAALQAAGKPLMLVGEWMIPHTINYALKAPTVVFYDIIDLAKERSMPISGRTDFYLKYLPDYQTIPVIDVLLLTAPGHREKLREYLDPAWLRARKSYLNPMVGAEGVVFKTDYHDCHAKFVSDEFKEKNAEVFGQSMPGDPPEVEIAKTYAVDARFRKIFQKIYPGEPDRVPDMKDIPQVGGRAFADILTEEILDIVRHWKIVNFKVLQGEVMKQTRRWIEAALIGRVTYTMARAITADLNKRLGPEDPKNWLSNPNDGVGEPDPMAGPDDPEAT